MKTIGLIVLLMTLTVSGWTQTKKDKHVLKATATTHSVALTWTASVVPTGGGVITGYNVYRANFNGGQTIPGTPYATVGGSTVTYTDTAVTALQVWYYKVTAVCATCSPSESTASNQLQVTIPADVFPQPAPPGTLTGVAQ